MPIYTFFGKNKDYSASIIPTFPTNAFQLFKDTQT